MVKIKVHGDRVCRGCQGLVHLNAFRDKYGKRKSYYCSEFCARKVKEHGSFEPVDVISK